MKNESCEGCPRAEETEEGYECSVDWSTDRNLLQSKYIRRDCDRTKAKNRAVV